MMYGCPDDIRKDAERQLVGKLYSEIIESSDDPIKLAVDLAKKGMTFQVMMDTVREKYGANLDGMLEIAGQLTEFSYASYNHGAIETT